MLYIHWNPDPVLIDLGFISLRWYSILFATGVFMSYWYIKKQFLADGISLEKLDKLSIYIIVGIVLGARLGHCLFYEFDYYKDHPLEMILPFRFQPEFKFTGFQGLASHGGAIGILTALLLFVRKFKMNIWYLLDLLAVSIPLTGFFIRMGNLMNSEIIGEPSDAPWAFIFKRVDEIPRHPGQLYEALAYLLIFGIMLLLKQRVPKEKKGILFSFFLILTFSARFLIEFLKENQVAFEKGLNLNMGQYLSIPFVLTGLGLLLWRNKKRDLAG